MLIFIIMPSTETFKFYILFNHKQHYRDSLDSKGTKEAKVLKARRFEATRETEVTEAIEAPVAARKPFHRKIPTKELSRVFKETWDRRETRVNLERWVIKVTRVLRASQALQEIWVKKEKKEFVEILEIR